MNPSMTTPAEAQSLSDVATEVKPQLDPGSQRLADIDALREALHRAVAEADESALLFLALAHNRTVKHTGAGQHIYPPVPQALLVDSEEQLGEELAARRKTPRSELISWQDAKARLLERFK